MTVDAQILFGEMVRSGWDALEFENVSDGTYDIFLNSGSTGIGFARIGGSEGARLAEQMRAMRSVTVDGVVYRVRAQRWESFGEYNYRLDIPGVDPGTGLSDARMSWARPMVIAYGRGPAPDPTLFILG